MIEGKENIVNAIDQFELGYSKALNDIKVEIFKIIDWSKDHGNNDELISKKQVAKIINNALEAESTKVGKVEAEE